MPITERITRDAKPRSRIALGGTGAGSIELRKDGVLRNRTGVELEFASFLNFLVPCTAELLLELAEGLAT